MIEEKLEIHSLPCWYSKKLLRAALLWLVLFGMEFDVRFYGPITLRKLSFLLLLTYIVLTAGIPKITMVRRESLLFSMGIAALGAYVIVLCKLRVDTLTVAGNSGMPAIQLLFQYIFIIPLPFFLALMFHSADEFCTIQLCVFAFQAAVAILGRLNKPFRLFVFTKTAYGNGRMLAGVESGVRVPIVGSVGATASWLLFAGCIFCACGLLKEKKVNAKYLLTYGVLLVSMAFVGRTGLYFAIALLIGLLFYFSIHNCKLALKIFAVLFLLVSAAICYVLFAPDGYIKQATVRWVGEIFIKGTGEGSTVDILKNMPVPPLNRETFWGTGIIGGVTTSGITVANDRGYVQTYAAWGVFGCLAYYGLFFGYLANCTQKVKDKRVKGILIVFLTFIMIAENKEPFLRKTPVAMIFALLATIQMRCERKCGAAKTERLTLTEKHFHNTVPV